MVGMEVEVKVGLGVKVEFGEVMDLSGEVKLGIWVVIREVVEQGVGRSLRSSLRSIRWSVVPNAPRLVCVGIRW